MGQIDHNKNDQNRIKVKNNYLTLKTGRKHVP